MLPESVRESCPLAIRIVPTSYPFYDTGTLQLFAERLYNSRPLSSEWLSRVGPMNKQPQIDLDELALALRAPGARAPLVVWMIEHHDELAAMLTRTRVNWASFCVYVDRRGFRNARGQSLTPENVRHCWQRARVVVTREKKAASRRRLADGMTVHATADGDQIVLSSGAGSAKEPRFEPARLRSGYRAGATSASPATPSPKGKGASSPNLTPRDMRETVYGKESDER